MNKIILFLILVCSSFVQSQTSRIIIDGVFTDWQNKPVLSQDENDVSSGIDLNNLEIFNDEKYLFVNFSVGTEINLSDNNVITLYLDADNNPNTGINYAGIGAELKFKFGDRSGQAKLGGTQTNVIHSDFGLFPAPSVTSNRFEFAIDRSAKINGISLFSGGKIKIVLKDSTGGDQMPNGTGGAEYSFANNNLYPLPDYSLEKYSNGSVRISAYNVELDGLFETGKEEYFSRILKAIHPEIIGFVEVSGHNATDAINTMENFLPSSGGQNWFAAKSDYDLIIASRYEIIKSQDIATYTLNDNRPRSIAFLLNLRPKFDTDMLVILSHPKCCSGGTDDTKRQAQVDAIMSFIRDAKNGIGDFTIDEKTPIVIMGDMNFVGDNSQLNTLVSGDIFDNSNYGADFPPDWDETDLEDTIPTTTNSPLKFTWYNPWSDYFPGRLDYILYSGSVLNLKNSFSLFTPFLDASTLAQYGLQLNDVTNASDHNPIVADFEFVDVTDVDNSNENLPYDFELYQNYPNPFNPSTIISYQLSADSFVKLKVFDVLGNEIAVLVNENKIAGSYKILFNSSSKLKGLPSGIYFYKLSAWGKGVNFISTKKMLLLK